MATAPATAQQSASANQAIREVLHWLAQCNALNGGQACTPGQLTHVRSAGSVECAVADSAKMPTAWMIPVLIKWCPGGGCNQGEHRNKGRESGGVHGKHGHEQEHSGSCEHLPSPCHTIGCAAMHNARVSLLGVPWVPTPPAAAPSDLLRQRCAPRVQNQQRQRQHDHQQAGGQADRRQPAEPSADVDKQDGQQQAGDDASRQLPPVQGPQACDRG